MSKFNTLSNSQSATVSLVKRPGFLMLLLSLSFIFACQKNVDTTQLFAANFTPHEMVLEPRSAFDTLPDTKLYNMAIAQYEAGEYAAAAESFISLAELNKRSRAYPYFSALSLLAAGDAESSIPYFEIITKSDRVTLVVRQARWYLALAQLHTKELVGAKQTLQSIEEGDFKYKEAQALLKKL